MSQILWFVRSLSTTQLGLLHLILLKDKPLPGEVIEAQDNVIEALYASSGNLEEFHKALDKFV